MDDVRECFIDNEQIKHERPVFHVPDVGFHAAFHLMQFLSLAAEAGYLCPAGDAGFHEVAHHVGVYQLGILDGMLHHVRTGTYQRHVAQEYVDELRQLVDVGLPHKIAELGLARIVLGGLHLVGILVHLHAAELVAPELLAVDAVPFLLEENRPRRGDLDDGTHYQVDEREERDEEEARSKQVERAFDETVVQLVQGRDMQAEYRYIAYCIEPHAVMQVVAYMGYVKEMTKVLFAPTDDFQNAFALSGRECGIDLVCLMLFQVFHDPVGATQIVELFAQLGVWSIIEIA